MTEAAEATGAINQPADTAPEAFYRVKIMARARRGRGEGSVFQRMDGRRVGRISLGYGGDGKRRRREVTGATKREVQQKLATIQQKAASGTLQEVCRLTLAQFLDGWLASNREQWEPATYDRNAGIVRNHVNPFIGGNRLESLRADTLRDLYAKLSENGRSDSTRKKTHRVLSSALKQATRKGLLPNNPAAVLDSPRYVPPERPVLTSEQARTLLKAAEGDRLEAFFVLSIMTGARRGILLRSRCDQESQRQPFSADSTIPARPWRHPSESLIPKTTGIVTGSPAKTPQIGEGSDGRPFPQRRRPRLRLLAEKSIRERC